MQWQAERQGVALRFPPAHPFNPLKALRLAIVAGCTKPAVQAIFRHIWRDGLPLDDGHAWKRLCEELGVGDPGAIDDSKVKDQLRRNGQRAAEAQVFGVPAFLVDHEIFWGFDSTDMLLDYLCDPHRFAQGELNRVLDLPGLPG